ncbi:MAG: hypothetical protein ACRBN8_45945 [Nannocystales bacterium]
MRLPASVLGPLRLGLGATALLAGGCDAQETRTLEPATAAEPVRVVPADDAPQVAAEVVAVLERAAAQAPAPTRQAVREVAAITSPLVAEVSEDLTAFVPFSEQPGDAKPIRPRIRTRVPARPRVASRPVEVARPWSPPEVTSTPKWDGGNCPACGRG